MKERTDASDALERLAWTLNYHENEPVSVNKLAEKTNLSWATAKKYTQVLERLSRISPGIKLGEDGISVNSVGENLASIRDRPETQLIVYLIIHAENNGGSVEPISIDEHRDVLDRYPTTIDNLEDIGWIAINDQEGTIQLTPAGVAQAGQARSKLRNTDIELPSRTQIVEKGDIVRTRATDTTSEWASGDYKKNRTTHGAMGGASATYNTGEYQSDGTSENWISA